MIMNPRSIFFHKMTPLRKLLLMKAAALGANLTEYEEEGNPAAFETNVAKPLTQLLVPFTPVQTGTGDPSPSNVRPITGWTGVTVYHSGADTSNPTTYPVTFPGEVGTVYGGLLDLTTGVLTETWAKVDASSFSWEKLAAQNPKGTAFNSSQAVPFKSWSNTYENAISNALVHASSSGSYRAEDANTFWWNDNRTGYRAVWGSPNAGASLDDFTAFLTDNNVIFVGELATPVTYQLTPQQITTIANSVNVLWTDTNGSNSVTYLKRG